MPDLGLDAQRLVPGDVAETVPLDSRKDSAKRSAP